MGPHVPQDKWEWTCSSSTELSEPRPKNNGTCQTQMFLLLMAKYWVTSLITSHCDTPEALDKTPVCHQEIKYPELERSSRCYKVTKSSAYAKTSEKKLHTSKVKQTQTKQPKRRESIINHNGQRSKHSTLNQFIVKITRDNKSVMIINR